MNKNSQRIMRVRTAYEKIINGKTQEELFILRTEIGGLLKFVKYTEEAMEYAQKHPELMEIIKKCIQ